MGKVVRPNHEDAGKRLCASFWSILEVQAQCSWLLVGKCVM